MYAVEFLLKNGADVNTKNSRNFTLLMFCTKSRDHRLIKKVIDYGANLNFVDLDGFSALDYAIKNDDLDTVKLLVTNGAKITDNSYMLAVKNNQKKIVHYFDCFDPNKEVFLKERCFA